VGSATVFQGIGSFSTLSNGMFINMDGALQPYGSVAATRIAVADPSAVNLLTGPVLFVNSIVPVLTLYGRQEQGPLEASVGAPNGYVAVPPYLDFSNAVFQISGQLANLADLPFGPSFNAANLVAGQNVDISTPAFVLTGGGEYTPASTITLISQTINGTLMESSSSGNFTDYTVSLAPYDLFPALAVQQGQTTLLTNPGQVEVYVDSHTQQLNTRELALGGTFRFYGLVFNDNGVLRMDCAQIEDGVTASSQASSSSHPAAGASQTIRQAGPTGSLPTITTVVTSD